MPTKPTKDIINASKKKLDGKAVIEAVINETPELRDALLANGIVEEIPDDEL